MTDPKPIEWSITATRTTEYRLCVDENRMVMRDATLADLERAADAMGMRLVGKDETTSREREDLTACRVMLRKERDELKKQLSAQESGWKSREAACVKENESAKAEAKAFSRQLSELAKVAGQALVCASLAPGEEPIAPEDHALIEAVQNLRHRAEQAEKRAEEAEDRVRVCQLRYIKTTSEMAEKINAAHAELDRLRGEMAGVAERQREACAAYARWGGGPAGLPYAHRFSQLVKGTPLVTDSKEERKANVMDAPGGPQCGCGKPSAFEDGSCVDCWANRLAGESELTHATELA